MIKPNEDGIWLAGFIIMILSGYTNNPTLSTSLFCLGVLIQFGALFYAYSKKTKIETKETDNNTLSDNQTPEERIASIIYMAWQNEIAEGRYLPPIHYAMAEIAARAILEKYSSHDH